MALEEPEMTQAQMKGMNLKRVFNEKFLMLLKKEFENIKFISVNMIDKKEENEEEKGKRIRGTMSIGHWRPELEEDDVMVVDANTPEELDKLISVIKKYEEGC